MKEQGMKSSLANISVAIRILIRFLILTIFSEKSSSSKVGFLEALFGICVLGDPMVCRVLTAFGSGVANPLIEMMLTLQMVVFAIHNLSDRFSLLGKDLLPSPFLILVLLCFAGILSRCRLGNARLADLSREG
jgi:branched-subunit amino acid transport protein AzlD